MLRFMTRSRPFNAVLGVLALGILLGIGSPASSAEPTRRALLIGCSEYPEQVVAGLTTRRITPLPGAANDVSRFASLLRDDFGFQEVQTLVGWSEKPATRPTAKAISDAFDSLVARTSAGDQIMILLSGHGTQLPVDASQTDLLDPKNPEPDGYDEVFLPADYSLNRQGIRDNQFGKWLDQLRDRGANVWIVFDCCFSGTMTRTAAGATTAVKREWVRGVNPRALGIDRQMLRSADDRARNTLVQLDARNEIPPIEATRTAEAPRASKPPTIARGQLVAFYACQPFEKAREVTRPMGGEPVAENRCGLLSYHLYRALRQSSGAVSYRDVARMIVTGLRAEMGSLGPTPMFEGDLQTEVLGYQDWPTDSAAYLERMTSGARLSVGELGGVTTGTILSVHPLDDRDWETPVGAVRVTESHTLFADVESVAWRKIPAVPIGQFPNPARCRVVSRTLGDGGLAIHLVAAPDKSAKTTVAGYESWNKSVEAATQGLVRWTDHAADAQLTIQLAERAIGAPASTKPAVVLVDSRSIPNATVTPLSEETTTARLILARYSLDPSSVRRLVEDVRRIRMWENLWRIAPMYDDGSSKQGGGDLGLRVKRLGGGGSQQSIEIPPTAALHPGDRLSLSLVNTGFVPLRYSVFFLDGRYGIHFVDSGTIRERGNIEPPVVLEVDRIEIDDTTTGIEGYVAIGIPLRGNRAEPDYRFIAQPQVGVAKARKAATLPEKPTPFEKLLLDAMAAKGRTRNSVSASDPHVASSSWVTVRKKTAED